MNSIKAVAVIVRNEKQQILLLKRGAKSKNEVGRWENSGGSIETGETPEQAIRREVNEEIGVALEELHLLETLDGVSLFEGKIVGEPTIREKTKCEELGWFAPSQLSGLPLATYTRKDFERLHYIHD